MTVHSAPRTALLAACAGVLMLAGCASMAPHTQRPAAPVAATFPGDPGSGGSAAADIDWQRFFLDPRLRELIDLALANNRDLRIAALNIEQARAAFDARSAERLPAVGIGVGSTRQPARNTGTPWLHAAGLQVTAYELDLFGRVRSLADAALAQYLATEEARRAVQISLVAAIASLYLAIQGDEALLHVTRQTLHTREESYRLTRLRFDHGVSTLLEVRQAETLLQAARAALAQFTRQRALDENALVLLVGAPLPVAGPPSPLPADATAAFGMPDLPAGIPSEVLARRPDVRQAEQVLRAADANIGVARAAFFPRITLTGSLGTASDQLSGLFSSGLAWSFAPQLLQPVFDAGRNRANLKVAEASQRIAIAQYERAVQVAFREVADALAGRATFAEQLRAQQAQVRAEQDRLRLAELGLHNGARSYLELLDARRSLFAAQQAEVSLRALTAQNLVTLYRVLGGGWTPEAANQSICAFAC
jgi:multidrug efflux system outer membrane protein